MKYSNSLVSFLFVFLMVGCASTQESPSSTNKETVAQSKDLSTNVESKKATTSGVLPSSKNIFYILADIPFSNEYSAANNVKQECTKLGSQFSNSIVKYAPKHGISVHQVTGELPKKGKVVKLSIQDVYSGGNAFIGHRKSATVLAILFIDGEEVSRTTKTRNSAGGAFGAFKGSCSILAHTVNTLGSDIGRWLTRG